VSSVSKKIVVFYSSIGHGHISAALAIKDEILRQDTTARVVLQDIRAFMHPVWRRIDERMYWFVANNLPECFESLFRSMQARGNQVPSLSMLPNDYPGEKVIAYVQSQRPDAILATHYGSAQVIATLRDRGLLQDIRIGWLHTDFFEGYLPRISKHIDRTFLAHPYLRSRWLAAGVPADKVVSSGTPVRIPTDSQASRQAMLAQLGLDPDVTTLLLTAGKEGACDYAAVITNISEHCQTPLQIIAVCGTNASQRSQLDRLQRHLPLTVALKVFGLLPHTELMSYMLATDLLITKAGGMTPAEAFAIGMPTILLETVSGHERENAGMFAGLGLAEVATNAAHVGQIVAHLLADPRRAEEMLSAQRDFCRGSDITSIARFALDESFIPALPVPGFGVENGASVIGINEALARLDGEAPCDIELLLSYAASRSRQRFVVENPFGHLAIRVGETVYSANHVAARQVDPNLLQHLSLADYLYGVRRPSPSQVHTSTYGMAYGRVTLGLRVAGVPPCRTAQMAAEAQSIEQGFAQAALHYDKRDFNCGDVVLQILQAGGYCSATPLHRLRIPTMPLDVFERARSVFEHDDSLRLALVAYRQVPGAQATYRFSRFPISLRQPLRSIGRVLRDVPPDPLEAAVMKQVTAYFGDRRLYFESLGARHTSSGIDDSTLFAQAEMSPEEAIVTDLRRLLDLSERWPLNEMGRLGDLDTVREIRRRIDHGYDVARMATERAEETLLDPQARRLRRLFTLLAADYGRIGQRHFTASQVYAYVARLRAFATIVAEKFLQE
jgi:UDP-N-acetylglucosamine:LPS N-acetylglucosamine transferase